MLQGNDIERGKTFRLVRGGIGYVPEDRDVFGGLTVDENLRLVGRDVGAGAPVVGELFPDLVARRKQRAGTLSGGQQQMVALARVLLRDNILLLVDEPTKGLAPEARHRGGRRAREGGGDDADPPRRAEPPARPAHRGHRRRPRRRDESSTAGTPPRCSPTPTSPGSCSECRCAGRRRDRDEHRRPPRRDRSRAGRPVLPRRVRVEPHLRTHGRAQLRARRVHARRGVRRLAHHGRPTPVGAGGRRTAPRHPRRHRRRGVGRRGGRGGPHPTAVPPAHPAGARHGRFVPGRNRCSTRYLGLRPTPDRQTRLAGGDGRGRRRRPADRPVPLHRGGRRGLPRTARAAAVHPPGTGDPCRRREPDHGRSARHRRAEHLHRRLRHGRRGRGSRRNPLRHLRRQRVARRRGRRC